MTTVAHHEKVIARSVPAIESPTNAAQGIQSIETRQTLNEKLTFQPVRSPLFRALDQLECIEYAADMGRATPAEVDAAYAKVARLQAQELAQVEKRNAAYRARVAQQNAACDAIANRCAHKVASPALAERVAKENGLWTLEETF